VFSVRRSLRGKKVERLGLPRGQLSQDFRPCVFAAASGPADLPRGPGPTHRSSISTLAAFDSPSRLFQNFSAPRKILAFNPGHELP